MRGHSKEKMNSAPVVLQLITGLGVGGAERVMMALSCRLSESGMRPVVAALNSDRRLLEQYPPLDFPVRSLGMSRSPLSFVKAWLTLIALIRSERVTLIHAHMFHALVFAIACKVAAPRCKVVFTSHSSKGFTALRKRIIAATRRLRSADIVFLPGQHREMNAAMTVVIPNGVPVAVQAAPKDVQLKRKPVFLFVGRLEPVKDPLGLIRSFANMRRRDCELWVVGEGILRTQIENEIEALGISERVRLLGLRTDVMQLLQKADCFVMASLWEGLPLVILEAGAMALPVIAPPVGAIPVLLDDECGYLVDASRLHHALDAVLDDYAEASRRGKRLQDKVLAGYTLEHMLQAHVELYSELVGNRERGEIGDELRSY